MILVRRFRILMVLSLHLLKLDIIKLILELLNLKCRFVASIKYQHYTLLHGIKNHCKPTQLQEIIEKLKPSIIEYPGYEPHSESGVSSLKIIEQFYSDRLVKRVVSITPSYIEGLEKTTDNYGYKDILYHPKWLSKESSNDNSTVKLFRSGSFNVLSLGDVENPQISSALRRRSSIKKEVDVMILAHHGANNGFTTSSFLKAVSPKVAIVSANYANQYEHPKPEIRELLHKNEIKLFTTKTGDVIIRSTSSHFGNYTVENLKSGSTEVSSSYNFKAKKMHRLKVNSDTIRARNLDTTLARFLKNR